MTEAKLNKKLVEGWLELLDYGKQFHYTKVLEGQVDPSVHSTLRGIMRELVLEGRIKSSGLRDGNYERIEIIKPITSWEDNEGDYFDIVFPQSHSDGTAFDFEHYMWVSPGDLIVVAGVSNAGKTTFALNLLGENLNKDCVLMGNEYTTADRKVMPKFKRRLQRMSWADWVNGDGHLTFELLPVKSNYEDRVKKGKLNIIDWIMMPTNFFEIQHIHQEIKARVGDGIAVVVMQKTRGREYADGGEFSERLADIYFTIDPYDKNQSRLTVGKVKEPKHSITGKSWAFEIVDNGANLYNIREVVKCTYCYGKGYVIKGNAKTRCFTCDSLGYIDKED